jgi:hypothetical protein
MGVRRKYGPTFKKPSDTVDEFEVGRLFREMTPRQSGPTSGLKVRFTNDQGRCDRSAEFANSVQPFLRRGAAGTRRAFRDSYNPT